MKLNSWYADRLFSFTSFIRVDMRKHQVNILLLETIKRSAFSVEYVESIRGKLQFLLLIWCTGIAIEDTATRMAVSVFFNGSRVY